VEFDDVSLEEVTRRRGDAEKRRREEEKGESDGI
jgi:hypothetical protein